MTGREIVSDSLCVPKERRRWGQTNPVVCRRHIGCSVQDSHHSERQHVNRIARGMRPAAVLFGLVLFCGAVSSCGGSVPGSAANNKTARPTPPGAASSSAGSTRKAVLSAYRAGWLAFESALADANPSDPDLSQTMVNPELESVRANLVSDRRQGIVGEGKFTLHPKISALSSSSATVLDCAYSTAALVYEATGKPVLPITPPENDGVTSTLVINNGTWKVSKQTVTDGTCAAGS